MKIGLLRLWSAFVALLFVLVVGGTILFLACMAIPQLSQNLVFGTTPPLKALLENAPVWDALWPAITGTVHLLAVTMTITLPLGIASGVYLSEYASATFCRRVIALMEVFAAIPSIVMGLFGFLLILTLRQTFAPQASTSLLLAAFCLSLLVLPVFILTLYAALRSLPHPLRLTVACVGLSRHAAVWRVFVPQASHGLVSAFFLAAGRCAEDTAVILMTGAIANASRAPALTGKFEALPFYIYYTTANYQNNEDFLRIFAAAFFLLVLAGLLLTLGHFFHDTFFKEWNRT